MIYPTFFVLATITGLWPIGKIVHFDLIPDYVKANNFDDFEPPYSTCLHNKMGSPSTPISDDEHVAFLSY